MPCDDKYLKIKWLDTKTEDLVLKKNGQLEYTKKRFTLSTQRYFSGYQMENMCMISQKIYKHKRE